SQVGNRHLFTGRELIADGLYDYRNRIYSPELGRFTATDSIRFAGGDTNLYGYVFNDPVNLVDQTGKSPVPALGPVAEAVAEVVFLTPEAAGATVVGAGAGAALAAVGGALLVGAAVGY